MDWCTNDPHVPDLPDELDELYEEFIKQDVDFPDLAESTDNNNMADNIAESEATVLLSLHLDLLNSNLDKNGKWGVRHQQPELSVDDLNLGGLKIGESRPPRPTTLFTKTKEHEAEEELKDVDERRSSPEGPENGLPRGEWGPESLGLWHSGPSSLGFSQAVTNNQDSASVISFSSSVCSGSQGADAESGAPRRAYSHQQLGAKVEMVYNLLSMLGTSDREDMSKTLLAMSSTAESCQAMRQSGCLPLLIQLLHASELDCAVRRRASEALANIVQAQTDDKRRRREGRVLKLLQAVREHCDLLKAQGDQVDTEKHPGAAVAALMKFSFDAEHRQAMCTLGGLHAIAELIQLEHLAHGSATADTQCVTLRRYAGMALTNLTFGDGANKALLCSFTAFMEALVAQLTSPSEDLRQVTASVVRNLSWRADAPSKTSLREVGAVTALMSAAMEAKKEATLKSILSALWNLSAHCSMNKVDICAVTGALAFLVRTLRFKATSSTLGIIENAGGILRNVSSHVAVRDDYRQVLRDAGCFEVLLEQLKSPSLTVVSNACGTLWNLSARCAEDQRRLWDMGATSMLRSLVQSKHKMIAMGSSAALKNLLAANPTGSMMAHVDSTARGLGLQNLPTLLTRKQRALEQELDATLAETCENIELEERGRGGRDGLGPKRSDSKESVTSTQSDSVYERVARGTKVLDNKDATLHGSLSETGGSGGSGRRLEEAKLLRRYRASGIPTLANRRQDDATVVPVAKPATTRRGIPVLKTRFRPRAVSAGPGPRFQSSDFPSELEEETGDCPVNYSLQDSEPDEPAKPPRVPAVAEVTPRPPAPTASASPVPAAPVASSSPVPPAPSGLYAETDLDQPTDFSLKYGEETSSDEEIAPQGYGFYDSNKNDMEDTTRTYYTEGTPYEGTPCNFSSATSMSDLRIDACEPCEPDAKAAMDEKVKEVPVGGESGVSSPGVKLAAQVFRAEASTCQTASTSVRASGTSSPAPVLPAGAKGPMRGPKRDFESGVSTPERPVHYCEEGTPGDCISRVSSLSSLSGKESSKTSPDKKEKDSGKVVTFTVTETPLMFSRSSSLTSLNSLAPPLPDGASSVVSSFSRVTSGAVSPSELPDSPTQTVPPSAGHSADPTVFDDTCARYKQEGTPIEFSRQTSLSCLSFDQTGSSGSSVCGDDKAQDQTVPERGDRLELASVSECDEDGDDDILADCISIGMQDTRNRPRMGSKPVSKPRPCLPARTVYEDSVLTYHTEDTPANISHAGSHSDLSILTVPGSDLSATAGLLEDGSANSSDTENILNECINSGMPQAKTAKEGAGGKSAASGAMGLLLSKRSNQLSASPKQHSQVKPKDLLSAQDEVAAFATENSPCTFSTRSSLSDLTVNTESPGPPLLRTGLTLSPALHSSSHGASPSSISLAESEDGVKPQGDDKREPREDDWSRPNTRDASFASIASSDAGQPPSGTDDMVTALSRSLSVESFDSCEPTPLEQALLEQCIHSGMPHRSKNALAASAAVTAGDGAADATAAERAAAEPMATSLTWPPADVMIGSQTSHTWSDESRRQTDVMVVSIGNHTWSDDVSLTASGGRDASLTASGGSSGSGEYGLHVVDGPRPAFRVGAGVMASPLARDASRICREIRKLQELEQVNSVASLTSLTSELSLASNDSFLDAELSGLELPDRPTPDFLASEEHPVTLKLLQLAHEPASLPSLGRPDHHLDLDLENSMVSVASITSEIADSPTLADSDTEIPDEDLSVHSLESLPHDTYSPKKPQRRLTPKEKRKQTQDRYRTYTLDELKAKCEEEEAVALAAAAAVAVTAPVAPCKVLNKITPKQRRLNDRDRFLTRTISLEEETVEPIPAERRFDTYRVRKERAPPSVAVGKPVMTAAERLELVANATLVAQSLNPDDRSIDTDTYVKPPPRQSANRIVENGQTDHIHLPEVPDDVESEKEEEEEVEVEVEEEPRGPRITVPGTGSEPAGSEDEEPVVRGVRGRRKPLYSSPALQRATKSGPPSPKITAPTVLRHAATNGSPARAVTRLPQPPPLVREGTFTKEENVGSNKSSRLPEPKSARPGIPRPASASASSLSFGPTRTGATSSAPAGRSAGPSTAPRRPPASAPAPAAHKRHSSAGSTSHHSSQSSIGNATKRHSASAVPTAASGLKSSTSNHSIKSVGSAKGQNTPPTASPERARPSAGKPKTPKKEVTSKIASLWKKVEETKRREKGGKVLGGKDTRVWITNDAQPEEEEVLVIEQEEVLELNSGKIVRSSTFQGESRAKPDSRSKTVRNSGDFSAWEGSRPEGRSVVSAIVAPYNYSPPQAKPASSLKPSPAPAALPQFPSKVTTV